MTAERIVQQSKEEANDFATLSPTPIPRGSIVLIGSVAAHQASRGQFLSDYAASKGAARSLTKELGVELAPYGIRVNCISPGGILLLPISFFSFLFLPPLYHLLLANLMLKSSKTIGTS